MAQTKNCEEKAKGAEITQQRQCRLFFALLVSQAQRTTIGCVITANIYPFPPKGRKA